MTIFTGRTASAPRTEDTSIAELAAAIQYYLAQRPRQLPSRYFYDELGSALFEAICRLPWYPITRAESRLLAGCGSEIFRRIGPVSTIVELGSGSGEKLRRLIDAAGPDRLTLDVHVVDVSESALEASARQLAPIDRVRAIGHQAPYEAGLAEAVARADRPGGTLVLFLGSNVGNFDPPGAAAFLHNVRAALAQGDALLLGADLVKAERDLLLAYDDPLGVTAAFNRNLLLRINRELAGDFDVSQFAHRAVWNVAESRIEMHLVARSAQHVHIPRAQLEFQMDGGEIIWTESSYKYEPGQLGDLLEGAGFRVAAQWIDHRDPFALTLAEAV